MSKKLTDREKVIRRLYALSNGDNPARPLSGICAEADRATGNDFCIIAFKATQELYGTCYPISEMVGWSEYGLDGMWSGERGELRRTLAGFVAAYMELGE